MTQVRERIQVTGDKLVETIKKLVHEGNVRKLIIRDGERTVMEIPLTVAAVGVLAAPLLAAIGAFAALASDYTLEVERRGEKK
ncbi:MAG: hypothetical protein XU14_C0004G0035 [Armatimonadetes bacterium CSP1-3]|nr:MAG: hypothetical protein XU14_C0004G0035 [Armatimonadetes bacterium CSP1-3]